mgnify:CR=1 FL=1
MSAVWLRASAQLRGRARATLREHLGLDKPFTVRHLPAFAINRGR